MQRNRKDLLARGNGSHTNISILIALIFSLPGILIAGFVGVVPLPKCFFNAWFGFRCPSCGTTSALRMLVLDNNLIASFKLQPFALFWLFLSFLWYLDLFKSLKTEIDGYQRESNLNQSWLNKILIPISIISVCYQNLIKSNNPPEAF